MKLDQSIIITGASSGFGKLTVPKLILQGHHVLALMRGGADRGGQVFPELSHEIGKKLHFLDIHLDQPLQVQETLYKVHQHIEQTWDGHLDVVIQNAGFGAFGSIEDQEEAHLRTQMEVNFFAPVTLVRGLLPILRKNKGKALLVSSIAGRYVFPFYSSYCASKFALEAITEGMYYEMKDYGVQFCLIEPGAFQTEFNHSIMVSPKTALPDSVYFNRWKKLHEYMLNDSRTKGDPHRVADLIVSLVQRPKIPLRRVIGRDAFWMNLISSLLPDWVRVRLTLWGFKLLIFKGSP